MEEEIGVIILYSNVLKAAVHSSTNLMSILKTAAAATIIVGVPEFSLYKAT
ncbi:hypothetical protein [Flavobacterium tructae]|uniref:hypothetical protein n=1 Tax=Flavobacterium tructae TaxID=1114873 RepID=UPI0013F4CB96|nr:hypothetical protein [Flavobacterium tructae]